MILAAGRVLARLNSKPRASGDDPVNDDKRERMVV